MPKMKMEIISSRMVKPLGVRGPGRCGVISIGFIFSNILPLFNRCYLPRMDSGR